MTPMTVEENLGNGEEEAAPFFERLGRRLLVRGRKVAQPGIQIDINQERPKSLGTVRLASADPAQHPLIDPNYLSDARDLDELVHGVHIMREVMANRKSPNIIKARQMSGKMPIPRARSSMQSGKPHIPVITPAALLAWAQMKALYWMQTCVCAA